MMENKTTTKVSGKSYPKIESPPKYRPTLHLDQSQLPAIKDWKAGETYDITLKVKMNTMTMNEFNKSHATFEILETGTEKPKK